MLESIIEQARQRSERLVNGRETFRDAEGKLCCAVCGERVEKEYAGIGRVFLACSCVQREAEEERLAQQRQEQRDRVRRLLSESGLYNPAYRRCSFAEDRNADSPELKEAARICRTYAERFEDFAEQGAGLLLTGPVGTGKTFYAAAIVNALQDRGVPALIVSTARLLNTLRGSGERQELLDRLGKFTLLVLDDLGAERMTDSALELLETVVDARALLQKPMCVTTNLKPHQLSNPADQRFRRLFDRLHSLCCIPVSLVRRSLREDQARIRAARCRELLQ